MGYAGGKTEHPTYGNLGDHTETVQVDFDPQRVSYAELLALFWKSHEPGARIGSRQYMNAVFYHDERQRQQAMDSRAAVEKQTGAAVRSNLVPLGVFYLAEDYHQKYLLKRHPVLAGELYRIYPRKVDLIDSTAAARLNGYAGGYGERDQLAREIELLGLSPQGRQALTALVTGRGGGFWN